MNITLRLASLLAAFALSLAARADGWMASLPDDAYINQISIPGSHDSATGHGFTGFIGAIAGSSTALTQTKTLEEQWLCGIRAFDLRPALSDESLEIYHGICQTKLSLASALTTICDLLDKHPSEFAVIVMRHETDGDNGNAGWADAMAQLLASEPFDSHIVAYHPRLTVSQLRGRIVILSRDQFSSPKLGFVSGWSHSPEFSQQKSATATCGKSTGRLYVQDFYDCTANGADQTKIDAVATMNNYAARLSSLKSALSTWVINHTSGYTKSASSDGNRDLAAKTNTALLNVLAAPDHVPAPTGIVMMDFAGEQTTNDYITNGQDLIDAIIDQNALYDMMTPIPIIPVAEPTPTPGIYNLQGHPVANPTIPGIYIINGHTVRL